MRLIDGRIEQPTQIDKQAQLPECINLRIAAMMPPNRLAHRDALVWGRTSNGRFTTKSAYELLEEVRYKAPFRSLISDCSRIRCANPLFGCCARIGCYRICFNCPVYRFDSGLLCLCISTVDCDLETLVSLRWLLVV